ncbi:MAG: VWA domain-containing protein [Myxococcales bacterium]
MTEPNQPKANPSPSPAAKPEQAPKKGKGTLLTVVLLVVVAAVVAVTVFGQNFRALFSASANALGGEDTNANVGSAGSAFTSKRKAIRNFGSSSDGEEGGGRYVAAEPSVVFAAPAAPSPGVATGGFGGGLAKAEAKRALMDSDGFARAPMQQMPMGNPLKAGATDDNAEFAEFVKFLASWSDRADTAGHADLMDVRDRHFIKVADAKGQPIPTAQVRVTDLTAQKSWSGMTYGDGRATYYPRIASKGILSSSYQVETSFGGMTVKSNWDGKSDLDLKFDADRSVKGAIQLDVVFVIDTTGSMGDEIDRIKGTLVSVTDRLRGLRQEFSLRYGAMLYKDRGDTYVTREIPFTTDIQEFSRVLQNVEAGGGGDLPESVNQALNEAVGMAWRPGAAKVMFLIGDASPHMDYGDATYGEAARIALSKGVKIHSVAASGLEPLGTLVWRQVAQLTRGKFIFIEYGSAAASAEKYGVAGDFKSNNLDDIIYEQIRDEVAHWGKDAPVAKNVAANDAQQQPYEGPIQLRKRNP